MDQPKYDSMVMNRYKFTAKLGGERCVKMFFNSIEVKMLDFACRLCLARLRNLCRNLLKKAGVVAMQKFRPIPLFSDFLSMKLQTKISREVGAQTKQPLHGNSKDIFWDNTMTKNDKITS